MASASNTPDDEIFLPNSETPGQYVDFGATLKDMDGKFVLEDVNEHGLAYSAGFRTGDILLTVNDVSTEGKDLQFLLDYLRRDRWANLLLAVERTLAEKVTFMWIIFDVITEDGTARVDVVHSLENDTFDMPGVDPTSSIDFLARSNNTYDIYIDSNANQSYLQIDKEKVVFGSYGGNSSKFYKYTYSGGEPSRGTVVAFSQTKMDALASSNKPTKDKTCFAGASNKKVEAMTFPSYMVGQNIDPDPRFWYEKLNNRRSTYTLESYKDKNWFLGKNKNQDKAVLSKTKTELTITESDGK